MAKKSPADLKSEGVELKAVLAKVKKKQHNCALLMSKDGIVLEVHLKKSPGVLLKAAKKAGGMAKGTWGTITMEGQVLIIDPINDKIPGNLTKVAKKFFAERGLKNRLEIKEPDESVASSEEAPDQEDAPARETRGQEETPAPVRAETPEGGEAPDPREALKKRLKALKPRIDTLLADKKSLMIDGLKDTMGLFTRAMTDELFDRAGEALGRVSTVLDDYDGLMALKKPFLDRMVSMSRRIEKIANGPDDDRASTISRYKREFEYSVENNEWFSSGEKLDQIEALIGEAEDSDNESETDEDPSPVEAQEAETTESAPENTDDERARLVLAFKALTPQIKTALKSDDKTVVKNLGTLGKGFAAAIKGGDLVKSQKILTLLETMVAQSTASPDQSGAPRQEQAANQLPASSQSTAPPEGDASANMQAKENRLSQLENMRTTLNSMLQEMRQ